MTPRGRSQNSSQPAGSPEGGEPAFLVIGKLRRPHGVRGEILMDVYTDFPERIVPGLRVFAGDNHLPLQITARRWLDQGVLLRFSGYPDRTKVGELRNQFVYVPVADRPALPGGDFYHHELLGLQVRTDEDLLLGQVVEILETGANDVLVVRGEARPDALIPITSEIVLDIDLPAKAILVHVIPGLLPE